MLRQSQTENKAKGTFIGTLGEQPIPVEAVQDPQRPGYSKPGPFTPDEFAACLHYGLRRPDGRPFSPLVTTRQDPLEPHRSEAPESKRRAVVQTEGALEAHRVKMRAAVDGIHKAQVEQQRAAGREDRRAYTAAVAAEQEAREEHRTLCTEESPLIKRVADAELELKWWLDGERVRRHSL